MKKSLSRVLILSAALLLASCTPPATESTPAGTSTETASSVTGSSTQGSTGTSAQGSVGTSAQGSTDTSATASASTSTGTSSQASEAAVAFTGVDVVAENGKAYAKLTGTISGFANADAMKMAFGLVDGETYIMGSATPADADYKYEPTVNAAAGTFELKVDLTTASLAQGMYTIMCGPKDHYAAVPSSVTWGTGKAVANGFRFSTRSYNGTIALDELPPIEMTISRVEVEGEGENAKVYHILGGLLNTTKMPQASFEALTPLMVYETTVTGWTQYTSNCSITANQIRNILTTTVSVDNEGNALIKTDVTELPNDRYNIKVNLDHNLTSYNQFADTKMDVLIDTSASPVIHGTHSYVCYADDTKSEKADIYGNCGLIVEHHHDITVGDKATNSDLYPIACADHDFDGYELRLDTTNTPGLPNDKKMKEKTSTFNITDIEEAEYEVWFKCHASANNAPQNGTVGLSVGEQLDDNGSASGGNAVPGRYSVQVGSEELVYTDTGTKNFYQVGIGETDMKWTTEAVIPSVMISGEATSFKLAHTGAGYSLYIEAIRLIKKGNYIKPHTPVVFTEGVMRIEAEDAHMLLNNKSGTITAEGEGDDFSGDKIVAGLTYQGGNWGQAGTTGEIDFLVKVAETRAMAIKVHAKSNKTTAAKVMELWVDDAKACDFSCADQWVDILTPGAMNITAGKHKVALKGVSGATVDIDYIEILDEGEPLHEHEWTAGQKVAAVTPSTCECGDKMYTMLKADATGDNDTTKKLGKNTDSFSTYDITGAIQLELMTSNS